ncbi:MAG TPA: hypothetical protein VKC56_14395 [Gallionellaceae bacterium]|nr:hypothetical protein [Gallionellaceae bacterium]
MTHAAFIVSLPPSPLHGALWGHALPTLHTAARDAGRSYATFAALYEAGRRHDSNSAVPLMVRADFLQHVVLQLPDVAARIDEDDFGVLHLEMGAMKLATLDAVRRHDLHVVRRHFAFISYLYEYANNELHDAIMVSYLEALFVDDCPPVCERVRSLLPASLAEALRRAELRNALLRSTWSLPATFRVPDAISLTLV